jgi:hypothetical protein
MLPTSNRRFTWLRPVHKLEGRRAGVPHSRVKEEGEPGWHQLHHPDSIIGAADSRVAPGRRPSHWRRGCVGDVVQPGPTLTSMSMSMQAAGVAQEVAAPVVGPHPRGGAAVGGCWQVGRPGAATTAFALTGLSLG